MAQGFCCNKYSYLYDGWNIMDFVVVIFSWITMFMDSANMSFIRTVRVLRTLRTLEAFPDLAELVKTLLELIPSMGNICILCFALVIVLSCISMQLFGGGSLKERCVLTDTINPSNFTLETWYKVNDIELVCNGSGPKLEK
jgi:hypothetical protein